jgi:hypothetical protein
MDKAKLSDLLYHLKWAVTSLGEMGGTPGSFEKENMRNAAEGIVSRIERCVAEAKELEARVAEKSS